VVTRVSASDDGALHWAIGHARGFPLISGIDLYGETVFDGSQIVELLAEWDRLLEEATSRSEEAWVLEVKDLLWRCSGATGRSVRFLGD